MTRSCRAMRASPSRPAWGGWIEMTISPSMIFALLSPVPHGAGGLKFESATDGIETLTSRPAWGGWIEILDH